MHLRLLAFATILFLTSACQRKVDLAELRRVNEPLLVCDVLPDDATPEQRAGAFTATYDGSTLYLVACESVELASVDVQTDPQERSFAGEPAKALTCRFTDEGFRVFATMFNRNRDRRIAYRVGDTVLFAAYANGQMRLDTPPSGRGIVLESSWGYRDEEARALAARLMKP